MEYVFKRTAYSAEMLEKYSVLLSSVFTDTKKYSPAFLEWQYGKNPMGKVMGYDAWFGTELAAHYVALPVDYSYEGKTIKGLLSLNTATNSAHQGKGLFTKLAERTYESAAQEGYKFVIGVANQNSTHGFLKKLGFKLLSQLEVRIFAGKTPESMVAQKKFHSLWNEESAKWRMGNPENSYFKNGGALVAKTHIGIIDAVLTNRNEFNTEGLAGRSALLKMTIGLNNNKGFSIGLPASLKPSPLNLIFKPLDGFLNDINSDTVFFELADFDAY